MEGNFDDTCCMLQIESKALPSGASMQHNVLTLEEIKHLHVCAKIYKMTSSFLNTNVYIHLVKMKIYNELQL